MTDSIHAEQNEARTRVALETGIGEMPFGKEEFLTEEQAAAKREALRYFQPGGATKAPFFRGDALR